MTLGSIRHWIIFKQGSNLLRKEQWQKAASLLDRAVRLAPNHWESHNNLAIALLKLGRWEEAAGIVQRAISLNPTAVQSHGNFGIALLKLERWDEAVAAYQRAITLDPASEPSYERLGIALSELGRWDEAAAAYRRAIELSPDSHSLHQRLGGILSMLERWNEAATAFRRAIDLDHGDPDSYAGLASALARVKSSTETVAAQQQAVTLAPTDAAAYLGLGVELLKLQHWEAAESALEKGGSLAPVDTSFQFLRVDPLIKLGRLREAAAVHAGTVGRGGTLPSLPGEPAPTRFERRRASFWTSDNLGADVFRLAGWLERLSSVPPSPQPAAQDTAAHPTASARTARLLFILDNDHGELTTLMYLLLGQQLCNQATLLLPPRLYASHADAIPGRTHCYGSVDDVIRVLDREKPDVVFLCSGYLFWAHKIFSTETLDRLVHLLRDRGCRVVTTDPFLGLFSKQHPRTLIKIDIPAAHPVWTVEEMKKAKRADEQAMWTYFSQAERILRDALHLYPTYCDVPEQLQTRADFRNTSFFNANLIRPKPDPRAPQPAGSGSPGTPHWMFVLSDADYGTQGLFEGTGFADIVAAKLVETVAAGRRAILVGPKEFVETLNARMPTAEGIDILYYCSFRQFTSLLLNAEYAFYWNIVSHSILIRLFNQLPIVLFDRGHLVRNVTALHDRVVQWYYQGWEPPFRDHRQRLTLDTVAAWAEGYRQQAGRICEGFRRAPTPEQMVAGLLSGMQSR